MVVPGVRPLPDADPLVMLAERSLPGSLIVDQGGSRFVNEACDYMSYGQRVLERERAGHPVEEMWLIFDQAYRNSYLMAAELFPRMPIPQSWYDAGVAHRSDDIADLAARVGLPVDTFTRRLPASTRWRRAARISTSGAATAHTTATTATRPSRPIRTCGRWAPARSSR